MQTLKIQIPEGYQIDNVDMNSGEIKFKPVPKDVRERFKTVSDVLAHHLLTEEEFDEKCEDLTADEKAYRFLKMLAQCLNEGWQPDWNNENQPKYYPWFYMGGSSGFRSYFFVNWDSYSNVGSRLCFKSSVLAEYAGTQFLNQYKQFMTI
ncbi:MAG: hypothetical protein O9340_04340 [Cyclobacteriaceae bacterium]|nr:hypothetical protein [Cyclobacteriaceae bacterium]